MKTVSEKILKSRMTELFREVETTGEELVVTDNGEMVLKIVSYRRESFEKQPNTKEYGAFL